MMNRNAVKSVFPDLVLKRFDILDFLRHETSIDSNR